jgi:hypothetical protein
MRAQEIAKWNLVCDTCKQTLLRITQEVTLFVPAALKSHAVAVTHMQDIICNGDGTHTLQPHDPKFSNARLEDADTNEIHS